MELTQLRCDQLTTSMHTMGNDIHSRLCQLEGEHSSAFPELKDRMDACEARACEKGSCPTPTSPRESAIDATVQAKLKSIEEKLEKISRPPSDSRSSFSGQVSATEKS